MYLVKGYIDIEDTTKHASILVEATGITDAVAKAAEVEIHDATSVSLSPIKEVVCYTPQTEEEKVAEPEYYTASVNTIPSEGEKPLKYQLLVIAPSFETAQTCIKDELAQGYDMTLVALKKTNLFAVIN